MIRISRLSGAVAAGSLIWASSAVADNPTAPVDPDATSQGDLAVTIYSDRALVQDIRQIAIPEGRSRIDFPDVSAKIQPETLSFAADGAGIVEQNFDFDLLTPTKLMEKAIGQQVTLVRTNPATGVETRERATVLSTAGGVVVKIGDRIEVLRDDDLPVRAVFDRVPPNLRARPTLSVTVDSDRAGVRPASIRYLTGGLDWEADYVALFDDAKGTVDMQGWVTLENETGTTFHAAKVLLVAGDPVGGGQRNYGNRTVPGTETANRERLGDFYLYPLAERTTIANAQTKQVSFLDVQAVPAKRVYSRQVGWLATDPFPVNVASAIGFSTSREQGLGDAMPAGAVRFYQRDAKGAPQFIGENRIAHTPMGSLLTLQTGSAFEVTAQAEVMKREEIDANEYRRSSRYQVIEDGRIVRQGEVQQAVQYWRTTMRYSFTNAKPVPVDIKMTQMGLDQGWWSLDYRVVSEDIEGTQVNLGTREWTVTVPANGKREVTVVYETKY